MMEMMEMKETIEMIGKKGNAFFAGPKAFFLAFSSPQLIAASGVLFPHLRFVGQSQRTCSFGNPRVR